MSQVLKLEKGVVWRKRALDSSNLRKVGELMVLEGMDTGLEGCNFKLERNSFLNLVTELFLNSDRKQFSF